MTAPKEIQWYDLHHYDGYEESEMVKSDDEDPNGSWVLHRDHLRAVTLAKIEVLEDLLRTITNDADGYDPDIANEIEQRIAALRKELEG